MSQVAIPSLSDNRKSSYFLDDDFIYDFQTFSPGLYRFEAYDFSHRLECKMILEIRNACIEDNRFSPVVSCAFPSISLQKLTEATGLSGYCQRTIAFLFQLKVLKELFLFCEEEGVAKIVVTAHEDSLDYLEIFSPFFASQIPVSTECGEQIQITIPADGPTYNDILDFTQRLEQDFRKVLWQEHRFNPIVHEYLKRHACV